ncbi:MAG TPA: DUF6798 domain-containing protein [Candidatus Nanoarchaeia archaeon]|nr:DUF6798 domain-containing protein [Candidatus Nanoarchaeia archaeon]
MKLGKYKPYCILLLFTIASIFIQGYSLAESDNTIYLPLVKYLNDKSLYPGDVSLEYLLKMPYPLYYATSLMSKLFGISMSYFILQVIARFLLVLSVYSLSHFLFKNKESAYLASALCFMVSGGTLAVFDITSRILIQHTFVIPFLIFSILLFLKKKYFWSFSLLGITANFHILFGGITLILLLFCMLATNKFRISKKLVLGMLIFSVLASPYIIKTIINQSPATDEWQELARIRAAHHAFPFTWTLGNYASFFGIFFLFIVSMKLKPKKEHHRQIMMFLLAVFMLGVIGTIFTELIPIHIVITSLLFRAMVIYKIFALVYISNYLVFLIKGENYFLRMASFGILASLFLMPEHYEPRIIFPLAIVLFVFNLKTKNRLTAITKKLAFLAALFIILILALGTFLPFLNGSYLDLKKTVGGISALRPLVIFAIFLLFILLNSFKAFRKNFTYSLTIVLIFLAVANNSFAKASSIRLDYDTPVNEWEGLAFWIKNNTDKNDLFITPPYIEGFNFFSERKALTDWKSCGQGFWQPDYASYCWNILKELNCNVEESQCIEGYNSLKENELKSIAKKHGAEYIITEKPKILGLEAAYENNKFYVYKTEKN